MILWRVTVVVVAFVIFSSSICGLRWRLVDLRYRKAKLLEEKRILQERIRVAQTALQRLLRPERLRTQAERLLLGDKSDSGEER